MDRPILPQEDTCRPLMVRLHLRRTYRRLPSRLRRGRNNSRSDVPSNRPRDILPSVGESVRAPPEGLSIVNVCVPTLH